MTRENFRTCFLIALISLVVFAHGLSVHGFEFRDDEVFYYKSTTEMMASGDILSPKFFGEDRFQKPILFYWLILLSYKVFGVSWFSARLVSCVFASATLVLTWLMTNALFNRRVAHLATLLLMTMPLFFRHAKNAVPDITLNFFIVLSFFCFIRLREGKDTNLYSLIFFISCALGFMIKGFAAVIVPGITVLLYVFFQREWHVLKELRLLRGTVIFFLITLPWFLYMVKVHGGGYFHYMWTHETADRLLKVEEGNYLLVKLKNFFEHEVFYLQIILQQFAPWSVLSLLGVGFATLSVKRNKNREETRPLVFLLSWIAVVYLFFSFMYFTISHYMLVMTTPMAIVTSLFLLAPLGSNAWFSRCIKVVRKYYVLFIFSVLVLVYSFIIVFFAGAPTFVLLPVAVLYAVTMAFIIRSGSLVAGPIMLGAFMMAIGYQTAYLSELGLTTHTTLRKFAQTISQQTVVPYAIGVGSHDLHEKELQIYFSDVRVEKVANDNDQYTTYMLGQLFGKNESVYCLMTEKDYNKYLKDMVSNAQVIHEESILRKRLNIDGGFFKAIVQFDRPKIHEYFMENVVLVKREKNV